jgi:protein-S-isoprenylcysteine O-methyltransferase Ste14
LLAGVGLVLISTFLIDHFDLFGLRQTWIYFSGRAYQEKRFATPLLYRWLRHPLYVGWLMTFWITPAMSVGHLLFAVVMSAYILIAIPMEERDLLRALGEPYRRWRERTPMFVPRIGTAPSRPTRAVESR